jgi:small-conductance mechanosensitive channel
MKNASGPTKKNIPLRNKCSGISNLNPDINVGSQFLLDILYIHTLFNKFDLIFNKIINFSFQKSYIYIYIYIYINSLFLAVIFPRIHHCSTITFSKIILFLNWFYKKRNDFFSSLIFLSVSYF